MPPLSLEVIRAATPRHRPYSLADGEGLLLQIMPHGSKRWRLRYRFRRLAKMMISLGLYPEVSLEMARDRRRDARELLAQGIDPSAKRRADKVARRMLFAQLAAAWFSTRELQFKRGCM